MKFIKVQSPIWQAVWERLIAAFGADAKKWRYVGSIPTKEGVEHKFRQVNGKGEWSTTTLTTINDMDYTSTQRS